MNSSNFFISSLIYSNNNKLNYSYVEKYLKNILSQINNKLYPNESIIDYEYIIAIDVYFQNEETIQSYLKQIKEIVAKNYNLKQKIINKHILNKTY